jgi:hypothetical protein
MDDNVNLSPSRRVNRECETRPQMFIFQNVYRSWTPLDDDFSPQKLISSGGQRILVLGNARVSSSLELLWMAYSVDYFRALGA